MKILRILGIRQNYKPHFVRKAAFQASLITGHANGRRVFISTMLGARTGRIYRKFL